MRMELHEKEFRHGKFMSRESDVNGIVALAEMMKVAGEKKLAKEAVRMLSTFSQGVATDKVAKARVGVLPDY
ncbi:Uncharacterised protein [uncultured archaeon]|nr:Uncharacterised protein [uncultured archaeon]